MIDILCPTGALLLIGILRPNGMDHSTKNVVALRQIYDALHLWDLFKVLDWHGSFDLFGSSHLSFWLW
jgi:hypothetical protein